MKNVRVQWNYNLKLLTQMKNVDLDLGEVHFSRWRVHCGLKFGIAIVKPFAVRYPGGYRAFADF